MGALYDGASGKMIVGSVPIDDTEASPLKTWSSQKTKEEIDATCEVQNVAFTFPTGMSDVNNRTRIVKEGNTVTAYLCFAYNQNITTSTTYEALSVDSSIAPIENSYSIAQTGTGIIFLVFINSSGEIKIAKTVGSTYEANKGIYSEISWHIGK